MRAAWPFRGPFAASGLDVIVLEKGPFVPPERVTGDEAAERCLPLGVVGQYLRDDGGRG